MDITTDELLMLLGEKDAQNYLLRKQLAAAQARMKALEAAAKPAAE